MLFSSRASVGGGPYVVEAAYPLAASELRDGAQPLTSPLCYARNIRDCRSSIAVAKP